MPSFCKVLIGGGRTLPCYGVPQHLPLIIAISYFIHDPVRALLPHQPKGLEATGDSKYGLSTIWVNPCQARVCSMEEMVKELTTWVSSGQVVHRYTR